MEPIRTLYICSLGIREPLVQTQVLPYLRQLAAGGVGVHILTFEPVLRQWSRADRQRYFEQQLDTGIRWHALPYQRRLAVAGAVYDVIAGAWFAARLAKRAGIQVFHARAHIPMLMAMLAGRHTGCYTVFDIRGLVADEYVDAGHWVKDSALFRLLKRVERAGIRRADQLVVLTHRMKQWLVDGGLAPAERIEVIPCCVDFSRFGGAAGAGEPDPERFELVYAGSVTGLYLLEEMAAFFRAVREQQPNAFFRILTTAPPDEASAVLRRIGIESRDFAVSAVPAAEVPQYVRAASLGVSFRKPTFAQIAASPTKVPEYLAAGRPVVCNAGIGDMDEIIERERVGVIVRRFDAQEYQQAAAQALRLAAEPGISERCLATAREYFDLSAVGAVGYRRVYQRLADALAARTNSGP